MSARKMEVPCAEYWRSTLMPMHFLYVCVRYALEMQKRDAIAARSSAQVAHE